MCSLSAGAGDLAVVGVDPPARTGSASIHTSISVEFDRPVDPATIHGRSFHAFGRWSGAAAGSFEFSDGDRTVTLVPDRPFSCGEPVMVVLSHDVRAADGAALRSAGYSYQFWTRARRADKDFTLVQNFSTRSGQNTRSYGGVAADLDRDGWLDLTIVNEDTDDIRVFMNTGDGQGTYNDFLRPPQTVGNVPSPSETADFDFDGVVDLTVANTQGSTVSILLGAGDGTWKSHQLIEAGGNPRGIAVLDADGDGDIDVVNTNADSSNLSLFLNDGNGVFGDAIFFDGGGSGEWALGAADMNEDGILDLAIGARQSRSIIINLGNGDGTFSFASSRAAGGFTWMINCGDVNGDGHEDVVSANSSSNNGSVLLGDGTGNLSAAATYATDPFPLATDVGDLDGDGDLDWATSSFSGDWFIFENNGDGTFTFFREINAPAAASCALLLDIDNDRDLDLALIDEIADRLITYKNSGTTEFADLKHITMVTGTALEGSVDDLHTSDDSYFHTRSGFGQTLTELHKMEMIVHTMAPPGIPSKLEITIESFIDHSSGTARIRLRDWPSGDFVQVGQYPIGMEEDIVTIEVLDAGEFIDDGGGIDLSIKHLVFVPFLAFTFESFIDHVEIAAYYE